MNRLLSKTRSRGSTSSSLRRRFSAFKDQVQGAGKELELCFCVLCPVELVFLPKVVVTAERGVESQKKPKDVKKGPI